MSDYRFQLACSTIRFKNGTVMVIQYVRVDLPPTFEKRGRRFKPAWTIC